VRDKDLFTRNWN